MINTIIIPLKLADGEHNVLQYAASFAKQIGARITLMHPYMLPKTVHYGVGADGFTTYLPDMDVSEDVAIRKEEISELVSEVPGLENIPCDWSIHEGPVSEVVAERADKIASEEGLKPLVIMGTFGATGVGEIFGTVAEKVTREADCPVLVIPGIKEYRPIRKVCLALDEESSSRKIDYSPLRKILDAYNARLLAIHVHDKDEGIEQVHRAILRQLENHFGDSILSKSLHTVMAENVEMSIDSFCHEHDIDLLALVYREHGFLKRLFSPGVRTKMVYHTDTPLLVLK